MIKSDNPNPILQHNCKKFYNFKHALKFIILSFYN